jgi:hypothetical protein
VQTRTVALRRGRPPKIAGTASRWWIYVSAAARTRAEERAAAEGTTLPDVLRAMLDAYAYGQICSRGSRPTRTGSPTGRRRSPRRSPPPTPGASPRE